jgi:hypothetical protein
MIKEYYEFDIDKGLDELLGQSKSRKQALEEADSNTDDYSFEF